MDISIFKREELEPKFVDGFSSTRVMADTCEDVHLNICTLLPGSENEFELYSRDDKIQFFAFTGGEGMIRVGKKLFVIDEMALFIPNFNEDKFSITAGNEPLEFIHIVGDMNETDLRQMAHTQYTLPRFVKFSNVIQYTERFTQESGARVKQHSVVAGRHLGRYTMGWVIGDGPDFVGQHVHPSLEQWYFMLQGADFIYDAGDKKIPVTEGDISYTPHGTYHGSTCDENGFIHYIWFELNRAWDMEG